MRIIAGKYRAKNLISPEDQSVRPTSDRAREAVFSILYSLGKNVSDKKVLDVFAGTGALGFEALSRGAKSVCFIDQNVRLLIKNSALFPAEKEKINIIKADVSHLPYAKEKYDIVFSDAPYDKGLNEKAFEELVQKGFLSSDAVCVVETRHNEDLNLPSSFELIGERVYGMAKVRFYIFHT